MQTATTQPVSTAVDYMAILHFLHQYRAFEKMPLEEGQELIRHLATNAVEHVCDQWRWKKRHFGVFFLNLDNSLRIAFLRHWGVNSPAFDCYLAQSKKDHVYKLFADRPAALMAINKLLIFFENNGIYEKAVPGCLIPTVALPKNKEKHYGNARNWADFILTLAPDDKKLIIGNILAGYSVI